MKRLLLIVLLICLIVQASAQNWNQTQKIVHADRDTNDYFGFAVSISGDHAIVSAIYEEDHPLNINGMAAVGSAYIFKRNAGGFWSQSQKIAHSDRSPKDLFGSSVSISDDKAILGTYTESEDVNGDNTMPQSGSAYVFEANTQDWWTESQKLVAGDRNAHDEFGASVSISGDYTIVGAHMEDEDDFYLNTLTQAGSAYIFERHSSGYWFQARKIVASDRGLFDHFGHSVAISGDYAVVGAYMEDEDVTGSNTMSNAGSAYFFKRDASGNWNETQKVVPSDRSAQDQFGWCVSISGTYAIISATTDAEDENGANPLIDAGSAYIFERDLSGNWNQVSKIVASDRSPSDQFGLSVSISGQNAIVGTYLESEDVIGGNSLSSAGSAYLFHRDAGGNWSQSQKIVASDRDIDDLFGGTVSISGVYSIVGAYQENHDASGGGINMHNSGSAYIYELPVSITVEENDFGSSFSLYPNPTSNQFTIDLGQRYRGVTVSITNVLGQTILTQSFKSAQEISSEIEGPAGIYLVTIRTEKGESATVKVIKE
jgi:hypothetical protein